MEITDDIESDRALLTKGLKCESGANLYKVRDAGGEVVECVKYECTIAQVDVNNGLELV